MQNVEWFAQHVIESQHSVSSAVGIWLLTNSNINSIIFTNIGISHAFWNRCIIFSKMKSNFFCLYKCIYYILIESLLCIGVGLGRWVKQNPSFHRSFSMRNRWLKKSQLTNLLFFVWVLVRGCFLSPLEG